MILRPTHYIKNKAPNWGFIFYKNFLITHTETIVYFDPIVQIPLRLLIGN
jgi:hypothetical protein